MVSGRCVRRTARPSAKAGDESGRRVRPGRDRRTRDTIDALHVLHEHVLYEPVRLLDVRIVETLADIADLVERPIAHHFSAFAESLEGVLGLPGHHDVADEPEEVAFACRVGKIARDTESGTDDPLRSSGIRSKLRLVFLQHALVFAHVWNVPRAQIAEAGILGLVLVIFKRAEKGLMLDQGVVDLTFQKSNPPVHYRLPG